MSAALWAFIDSLTPDDREHWEERAGIMQHDGGLTREEAELEAGRIVWREVQSRE